MDYTPWYVNGMVAGYAKSQGNLEFRTVNKAGHLVPNDQPEVALALAQYWVEAHRSNWKK